MLEAVAVHGRALRWASAELKGDKAVVLAACANDPAAMMFADEHIRFEDEDDEPMVHLHHHHHHHHHHDRHHHNQNGTGRRGGNSEQHGGGTWASSEKHHGPAHGPTRGAVHSTAVQRDERERDRDLLVAANIRGLKGATGSPYYLDPGRL
jgi:hypothetical protein